MFTSFDSFPDGHVFVDQVVRIMLHIYHLHMDLFISETFFDFELDFTKNFE